MTAAAVSAVSAVSLAIGAASSCAPGAIPPGNDSL